MILDLGSIPRLVERVLNDEVLGFLALVTLFLLMMPAVFSLSTHAAWAIGSVGNAIAVLFGIEYSAALWLAPDKRQFVMNKWRVIDGLIIVTALVTMLPFGPDVLRHSPALRLFRFSRLALLGTRSSIALRPGVNTADSISRIASSELKVFSLGASGMKFELISWEESLESIRSAEPDWLFISGVSKARLRPIADALGVPVTAMEGLFESKVPQFGTLERFSTFFVRHPLPMQPGERLQRTPVLLVGTADNVVVLSREHSDLARRVEARLATLSEDTPRMVRATLALISEIMRAYTNVIGSLEGSLQQVESVQISLKDEDFLAKTFQLRADILKVRGSLKHLQSMIRDLSRGKLTIVGSDSSDRESFLFLNDDAADLYEDIEDLRESLQGLVDLRLNVSSFQMNRVMRLLALLTSLALIPATVGGLLGMNLADAPWSGTLPQVAFGVAAGMSLSLYIFAVKGWLR